jgi:predicted DNA-binding transcriptional regulator AlpA
MGRAYLDLVDVSEVADLLGMSRQRVHQMCLAETVPTPAGYVGARRQRVWYRADILAWLERRAVDRVS